MCGNDFLNFFLDVFVADFISKSILHVMKFIIIIYICQESC